jgi:hypothetical protein
MSAPTSRIASCRSASSWDLVPSRLTIYFKAWIGPDLVSHLTLIDRRNAHEHRIIDAKVAKFVREGRTLSIVLGPGQLHIFDQSSGRTQRVAFREYVAGHALDDDTALATREGPHFYRNGTLWLLAPPAEIRTHEVWYRHSQAELHKRLATPFFVFCYAPLIIAIAFFTERTGRRASLQLGVMPLTITCAHIALIVLFETGVRTGPGVVFLAYFLLAGIAAAAAGLIHLHDSGKARELAHWPRAWAGRTAAALFKLGDGLPIRLRSAMLRCRLPAGRAAKYSRDIT